MNSASKEQEADGNEKKRFEKYLEHPGGGNSGIHGKVCREKLHNKEGRGTLYTHTTHTIVRRQRPSYYLTDSRKQSSTPYRIEERKLETRLPQRHSHSLGAFQKIT